jgi:hypothetical protein
MLPASVTGIGSITHLVTVFISSGLRAGFRYNTGIGVGVGGVMKGGRCKVSRLVVESLVGTKQRTSESV